MAYSKSIKLWAKIVHKNAKDKGFYSDRAKMSEREHIAVALLNIVGEALEAWEAYRSGKLNKMCNKAAKMRKLGLRPLTCIEEELADIIIRVMDTAQALGIDIEEAIKIKHAYNTTRPQRHGGKLA